MWPLGASAAEEVAATVVSIDVPSDYKWVLLALVGAASVALARRSSLAGALPLARIDAAHRNAQASSLPTSTSSSA